MKGRQRLTAVVVFGGVGALLGGWEWYTLVVTPAPDDHITASLRAMAQTDLGVLILMGVSFVLGVVAGHVWNKWGGNETLS